MTTRIASARIALWSFVCRIATLAVAVACLGACGAETSDPGDVMTPIPVEELADVDAKADSARAPRFETFTGLDGKSYFHLLAANGQKVLQSQGYASAENAALGIDAVRRNGALPESYDLLPAQNGQWYFNLVAANGEIVASSELYVSRSNAERAIDTAVQLVNAAGVSKAPASARFQVFRGFDGQQYFHLRAANGEIVLVSQGYTRKSSALDGIASVRANGADLRHYQIRDAADGQAYFVLVATNGQVIGVSETYDSRSDAQQGAATVAGLLSAAAF